MSNSPKWTPPPPKNERELLESINVKLLILVCLSVGSLVVAVASAIGYLVATGKV
jgi:hypothetical protein